MRMGTVAELAGRPAEAVKHYADAAAAPEWPKHDEALAAQARALQASKDYSGCVDLALKNLDDAKPAGDRWSSRTTRPTAPRSCPSPTRRQAAMRQRAAAHFRSRRERTTSAMSADDRSDYWAQTPGAA